jgi:toxin ParE1/3/4
VTLVWTERAVRDLDDIEGYIARDNRNAAIDVVLTIIQTAEIILLDHKFIGKAGKVHGTRELVVPDYPSYIIVYKLVKDRITILRVLHGARLWPESF